MADIDELAKRYQTLQQDRDTIERDLSNAEGALFQAVEDTINGERARLTRVKRLSRTDPFKAYSLLSGRLSIISKKELMEIEPALHGATKTQDGWIEHSNNLMDGERIVSAAEIYQIGKQAKASPIQYEELLQSLKKDFYQRGIVTSTRNQYNSSDLSGKVIQRFGSDNPGESSRIEIPVLMNTPLDQLSEQGIVYLQTVSGTEDSLDELAEIWEIISGKSREDIKLLTRSQRSRMGIREDFSEGAVSFGLTKSDLSGNLIFCIRARDLSFSCRSHLMTASR